MGRRTEALTFRWLQPHQFVAIFGTVAFLTIVISYVIASSLDHVYPLLPYISDTGTKVPESCVFGLLLNCASVFAGICFYIRHRHVAEFAVVENHAFTTINDVTLLLGFAVSFGMMVVASFQETSVLVVHLLGAILVFAGGLVYCWLHCYISYKCLQLQSLSKCCFYFRIALTIVTTLTFIMTFAGASAASAVGNYGPHKNATIHDNMQWEPSRKGYDWHLISTFSEWIMAICFFCFVLSFFKDFQQFKLSVGAEHSPSDSHRHEISPLSAPIV